MAHTPFGALRACESFSQMVEQGVVNGSTVGLRFDQIEITDAPHHPVRSVMIDISRRLYPMPLMRSILDAMSYAKLNVLVRLGLLTQSSTLYSEISLTNSSRFICVHTKL